MLATRRCCLIHATRRIHPRPQADLKAVLRLNPGNASAKRDLAAIKARYDQQVAGQRKAMQKMFAS